MVYEPTSNDIYEADYRVREDGELERTARKQPNWLRRKLGPVGVGIVFVLTKLKTLLLALKSITFFSTGVSAAVSIGAYALFFGWQFALGFVVLLFIHEMGHAFVLRHYGVAATAPVFIPFMGAIIGMRQLPKNAVMEAYVGLGGPVIGSLGAMAAWGVYELNGSRLFLALAYTGIFLNLFNLLPILPLDGGRAVSAISRWFWIVGLVGVLGLIVLWRSPILLIILLFSFSEFGRVFRGRNEDKAYYNVPLGERVSIAGIYFGLIGALAFSLYHLEPMVHALRP
jgi:Zn-dependent protease